MEVPSKVGVGQDSRNGVLRRSGRYWGKPAAVKLASSRLVSAILEGVVVSRNLHSQACTPEKSASIAHGCSGQVGMFKTGARGHSTCPGAGDGTARSLGNNGPYGALPPAAPRSRGQEADGTAQRTAVSPDYNLACPVVRDHCQEKKVLAKHHS